MRLIEPDASRQRRDALFLWQSTHEIAWPCQRFNRKPSAEKSAGGFCIKSTSGLCKKAAGGFCRN